MEAESGRGEMRSPADAYRAELLALNERQAGEQRRERLFGYSKLAIAAATLIAAAFLTRRAAALAFLSAPVVAFIWLAVAQEKLIQSIRCRERALRFYRRGLDRLNGGWAGRGEPGEQFVDAAHPYARDLDLFGSASLFEYLNVARTHSGEATLAQWLLSPASVDQVHSRQTAVRELAVKGRFREGLWSAGEPVRAGVHPDVLMEWGEREPAFTTAATRTLTTVLCILWMASAAAWAVYGASLPVLLITILNFAYSHRLHPRMERAVAAIERADADLRLLAAILEVIEREDLAAERLRELKRAVERRGLLPSVAIRKLARMADIIESRHSLFARPIDLVTFWSAQFVFQAERWQREFGPAIRGWLAVAGEVEALSSLAAFTFEHPAYVFPEFVAESPCFAAEAMAHPLLPTDSVVRNDVEFGPGRQLMLLSGPNMAGKSTFIRGIGVNAVLAQCGAPVCASRLRMSSLQVAASICVLDSLSGGVSRFYAEIRRVKQIADLAESRLPVLFLLDELLSGTNSHDRLIGTRYILETLVEREAIGVVSTHDLALTAIADQLNGRAFNAHFEDRIEDGNLIFDYRLKPGVVRTSNALELMKSIGLGVVE